MNIKFPDGTIREFPTNSTGLEIAKAISEGLARNAVGILLNGEQYDLNRPISSNNRLCELIAFAGRKDGVFRSPAFGQSETAK